MTGRAGLGGELGWAGVRYGLPARRKGAAVPISFTDQITTAITEPASIKGLPDRKSVV